MDNYSGAHGNKTRLRRAWRKENIEETDDKVNDIVDEKEQGASEMKDKSIEIDKGRRSKKNWSRIKNSKAKKGEEKNRCC